MRFFQYSAIDGQGRPFQGTVQAADANAARLMIAQKGLNLTSIQDKGGGPVPVAQPSRNQILLNQPSTAPAPIHLPPQPVQQQPRIVEQQPVPAQTQRRPEALAPQATPSPIDKIKTRKGSDKDIYFIFSQLSSYFKSGTNPQQALSDLSNRQKRHDYQTALKEAAAGVANGGTISGGLERYPYLFSPDVVGTVAAAERGGFLPEACDVLAEQHLRSHQLKRKFSYFIFMAIFIACVAPILLGVVRGSVDTIGDQWEHDGGLAPAATMAKHTGANLKALLPLCLAMFVGSFGFLAIWNSMPLRRIRHQMVLLTPGLGKRARSESLTRVSWVMGMAAKSGGMPNQILELGAASAPNMVIADRLVTEARGMRETEKLSAALYRSNVIPEEYAPIVETGEVTGDIPSALLNVARASDVEYRAADSTVVLKSSVLFYVVLGVAVAFLLGFLYKTLILGYFEKIQ